MSTFKGIDTIEQLKAMFPNAEISCGPARNKKEPSDQKMVHPAVVVEISADGIQGKLLAYIPAVTRSEANESAWHKKMIRKLSAKEAVRTTLGLHHGLLTAYAEAYHSGKALKVRFTRLGGRRLDPCNLPSSMKAVEDSIALALLADDGSPLWRVSYEQEPGGPTGVLVEIEVFA